MRNTATDTVSALRLEYSQFRTRIVRLLALMFFLRAADELSGYSYVIN